MSLGQLHQRRVTEGRLALGLTFQEACSDGERCEKLARRSAKTPEMKDLKAYAQATIALRTLQASTASPPAAGNSSTEPVTTLALRRRVQGIEPPAVQEVAKPVKTPTTAADDVTAWVGVQWQKTCSAFASRGRAIPAAKRGACGALVLLLLAIFPQLLALMLSTVTFAVMTRGLQVTGLFLTGLARGLAMNAGSLWTGVQHLDTAVVGSIAQAWQPPPPPYTTSSLPPLYLNQSSSDGFPNHVDP